MTRFVLTASLLASSVVASSLLACETGSDETTQTTASDSGTSDPTADSSAGDDSALGCAVPEEQDTTDGMTNPLQETWGSACTADAECVERIGAGAVCLFQAVVFELPHGYCTKPCTLPDSATRIVPDDPVCDPNGGIACTGQAGAMFEYCAPLCTDDAQCNRDGYTCRQMPVIAQAMDPSICLMPDCCEGTCDPND